jgi:hypothetical protein
LGGECKDIDKWQWQIEVKIAREDVNQRIKVLLKRPLICVRSCEKVLGNLRQSTENIDSIERPAIRKIFEIGLSALKLQERRDIVDKS